MTQPAHSLEQKLGRVVCNSLIKSIQPSARNMRMPPSRCVSNRLLPAKMQHAGRAPDRERMQPWMHIQAQGCLTDRTMQRCELILRATAQKSCYDGINRKMTTIVIGSHLKSDRMGALVAWQTPSSGALRSGSEYLCVTLAAFCLNFGHGVWSGLTKTLSDPPPTASV